MIISSYVWWSSYDDHQSIIFFPSRQDFFLSEANTRFFWQDPGIKILGWSHPEISRDPKILQNPVPEILGLEILDPVGACPSPTSISSPPRSNNSSSRHSFVDLVLLTKIFFLQQSFYLQIPSSLILVGWPRGIARQKEDLWQTQRTRLGSRGQRKRDQRIGENAPKLQHVILMWTTVLLRLPSSGRKDDQESQPSFHSGSVHGEFWQNFWLDTRWV